MIGPHLDPDRALYYSEHLDEATPVAAASSEGSPEQQIIEAIARRGQRPERTI
ncbi:hypothetical protein [Arthrobacter gyeryongensis]|uniref:hypothetical protein n=1 Tax=Arthrobacter gyeryongensis TaxID=1650592 RepID=UPI0031EC0B6B